MQYLLTVSKHCVYPLLSLFLSPSLSLSLTHSLSPPLPQSLPLSLSVSHTRNLTLAHSCYHTAAHPSVFLPCSFAGYKAGACSHGDGVITALQVLFAPVPIGLLVVGLVFFCLYPIDEARQRQSQNQSRTNQEQAL